MVEREWRKGEDRDRQFWRRQETQENPKFCTQGHVETQEETILSIFVFSVTVTVSVVVAVAVDSSTTSATSACTVLIVNVSG